MDNEIIALLKEFKDDVNKQFKNISVKLDTIESDVNTLKVGREEIKTLIADLEPKNGKSTKTPEGDSEGVETRELELTV